MSKAIKIDEEAYLILEKLSGESGESKSKIATKMIKTCKDKGQYKAIKTELYFS